MSAQWFYAKGGESIGPYAAGDIQILLRTGEITADTLVWREGIAWGRIAEQSELAGLILTTHHRPSSPNLSTSPRPTTSPDRTSSPHPEALEGRGRATAREAEGTLVIRLPQYEDAGNGSAHGADAAPGKAPARRLAGRWPRLIARLIDFALDAALVWGMWALTPVIRHYLYPAGVLLEDLIVFSIRTTPLYVVLLIMFIFGETPGKLIIGIRAVPIDGRAEMHFVETLSREIRFLRTALFSPLQLFTDWDAAGRREPASYDIGRAEVVEHVKSVAWRMFIVVLTPLIIAGVLYTTFYESRRARTAVILPPPRLENTVPEPVPAGTMAAWTNPRTGIAVSIPADWRQESDDGASTTNFANPSAGLVAYFECTTRSEGMNSFADYRAMTEQSLPSLGTFSAFVKNRGTTRLTASGNLINSPIAALVVIGPGDGAFCRLTYADMLNSKTRQLNDEALTAALFESVGG